MDQYQWCDLFYHKYQNGVRNTFFSEGATDIFTQILKDTAGNRHKQNSWFCKEIREDNFRFWWRRVHEDASQGMYTRGGFRGGRAPPPPKIRKAYVIQR